MSFILSSRALLQIQAARDKGDVCLLPTSNFELQARTVRPRSTAVLGQVRVALARLRPRGPGGRGARRRGARSTARRRSGSSCRRRARTRSREATRRTCRARSRHDAVESFASRRRRHRRSAWRTRAGADARRGRARARRAGGDGEQDAPGARWRKRCARSRGRAARPFVVRRGGAGGRAVPRIAFATAARVSARVRIEGIVNGTSHYVAERDRERRVVRARAGDAVERGFAEPDSSADISGRDAAEKLTILLHLAGRRDVAVDDLPSIAIDVVEPADLRARRVLAGRSNRSRSRRSIRPGSSAWVGPAFVDRVIRSPRSTGSPTRCASRVAAGDTLTFAGPGAGPRVDGCDDSRRRGRSAGHRSRPARWHRARQSTCAHARDSCRAPGTNCLQGPWFLDAGQRRSVLRAATSSRF